MTDISDLAPATQAVYTRPPVFRGVIGRFPRALREIARVSEYGCRKHKCPPDDVSYTRIPDAQGVYDDKVERHAIGLAIDGKFNPDDENMRHRAQRAWNALAALEVELLQEEIDEAKQAIGEIKEEVKKW